jgi:ribosomal protein S18 acetylase RimI-like enzyme
VATRTDPDLARALAFEDAILERASDTAGSWPHGRAFFTPSLPLVYDLSFVVAEPGVGAGADELARDADRAYAQAGMRSFRRVVVPHEADADRLAPGFAELGWHSDRHVYLVLRRAPDREPEAPVRESDVAEVTPAEAAYLRSERWATSEEVVRQVIEKGNRYDAAIDVRYFAGVVDGSVAAWAKLFSVGNEGQVEDVATLPFARGRGLARGAVTAALRASQAAGHEFTFIVADDDDWPKELYRKLGFEDVGIVRRFTRR